MDEVTFFVVAKKVRAQQGFDFRIKMRKERRPTKQKPIKEENIKKPQTAQQQRPELLALAFLVTPASPLSRKLSSRCQIRNHHHPGLSVISGVYISVSHRTDTESEKTTTEKVCHQTQAQKAGVEDFLAAFEKMPESLTVFSSRRCAVFWSEETVHSYAFVLQKPYLFIDTSGVSGQATVRPHNPVAGNDEGNGIVPNSSSDGLC